MKTVCSLLFCFFSFTASAQYYYKDIIGTQETTELVRLYRSNRVKTVVLSSFDGGNKKNEQFFVEQQVAPGWLKTTTRTDNENSTSLVSTINEKGQVVKTQDSTSAFVSVTNYTYTPSGVLASIVSTSSDGSGTFVQTEEHRWAWDGNSVSRMLRIKNGTDTSFVEFKKDENGNVAEEKEVRRGIASEPVYYYYDAQNRLTDIVRYSPKAKRLLPEYMFEYSPANQVIQKITVPANNSEYLIWRYQYNSGGLKTKEAVYSKDDKRVQLGRLEYVYTFSS